MAVSHYSRSNPAWKSLVVLIVALPLLLWAAPLPASGVGDYDIDALLADLDECESPTQITLIDGSIITPGQTLVIECDVTINLNGSDLTVQNIVINPGNTLTIQDTSEDEPGTLTAGASSTNGLAGIRTTSATLIIEGGIVVAWGGAGGASSGGGAGIGGGGGGTLDDGGDGGNLTIAGGAVNATGGSGGGGGGAGIGGGWWRRHNS